MKPVFFQSLMFKVAALVIFIEVISLTIIGAFYVQRFSAQVDARTASRVQLLGKLLSKNFLQYESVDSGADLNELVREDVQDALIVGFNGIIHNSANPAYVGRNVTEVPGLDRAWFIPSQIEPSLSTSSDGTNNFLTSVTPISMVDGSTPYLFAYFKIRTTDAEKQKQHLRNLFVVGSVISLSLSSLMLLVGFRVVFSSRIDGILRVLRRAEKGDLAARVTPAASADEIGAVQLGVNAMIQSLQQRVHDLQAAEALLKQANEVLEERVQARTLQLSEANHQLEHELHERRRAEAQILQLNDSLEIRVRERTTELASVNRALMQEIVKHQQTESALRRTEEKYRAIVENAVEGIYQSTPGGRFLSANPAMADLLGYPSPAELLEAVQDIGSQFYLRPEKRAEFKRLIEVDGRISSFEFECRRGDGSLIWLSSSARAVLDPLGNLLYYDGVMHDITARKQAEHLFRELPRRILEAQEAERRRVSRELHDGVNQLLASIRFRIQSVEGNLPAGDAPVRLEVGRTKELLESAIREVRQISRNLRPSELDDLGLLPALRSAGEEFQRRSGIQLTLEAAEADGRFAPEIELHLYRIVQEALTNIEKHSGARQAAVRFERYDKHCILTIRDDGRGWRPVGSSKPVNGSSHFGIVNMRERAGFTGGVFTITALPTRGTEIMVQIPFDVQPQEIPGA